ncbi:tetratricopeptide repeat protein [Luteolibacter pohnpeiensis]|nr:hypothetical protein [Luteolibacter pohnpeiensis]
MSHAILFLALVWVSPIFSPAFGETAENTQKPDFFDVVGKTPATVVAAIPRPTLVMRDDVLMSGFVGLPMSSEHRKEFIAALRASMAKEQPNPNIQLCLTNLLEEDHDYPAALDAQRGGPITDIAREASLLWKLGETEEAKRTIHDGDTLSLSNVQLWLSVVRNDVIANHQDEAMELLSFLEQQDPLAGRVRTKLAIQHLEIARRTGNVDKLLQETESPVLRALWHDALGQTSEYNKAIEEAGKKPSVGDLETLYQIHANNEPILNRYLAEALNRGDLTTGERRRLLQLCGRYSQPLIAWLNMPTGQIETADLFTSRPGIPMGHVTPEIKQRLLDIFTTDPGNSDLNLIMASSQITKRNESVKYLEVAATDLHEELSDQELYQGDNAYKALRRLSNLIKPETCYQILKTNPKFEKLSPERQIYYLIAADLEDQIDKTIPLCHFQNLPPSISGFRLLDYFNYRSRQHGLSEESLAILLDRLPDLLMGDRSVSPLDLHINAYSTFTFLINSGVPNPDVETAISKVIVTAGEHSESFRQSIINAIPKSAAGLEKYRALQTKPIPRNLEEVEANSELSFIYLFLPPDVSILGQGFDTSSSYRAIDGHHRVPPPQNTIFSIISIHSPWVNSVSYFNPESNQLDTELQARLRIFFADFPERTLVYDLLVQTGEYLCPDEKVVAIAKDRIENFNKTSPIDPTAGMFLFAEAIARGHSPEESAHYLENCDQYLCPAKARAFTAYHNYLVPNNLRPARRPVRDTKKILETIKRQFNSADPKPEDLPTGMSDSHSLDIIDQLKICVESDESNSERAIDLAKQILARYSQFWNSNRSIHSSHGTTDSSPENTSYQILINNHLYDGFEKDLVKQLEEARKSDITILRVRCLLHSFHVTHSTQAIYPYAKQLFKLDPSERWVAADVLAAATEENNPELALRAMESLYKVSPSYLMKTIHQIMTQPSSRSPRLNPFELFTRENNHQLVELLLNSPILDEESTSPIPTISDQSDFLPLYRHLAKIEPESLKPILNRYRAITPANGRMLAEIASELVDQNHQATAVDILADAYFTVRTTPSNHASQTQPTDLNIDDLDIEALIKLNLAIPLADAESRYPETSATARVRLIIKLAAYPNPETLDQSIIPFLKSLNQEQQISFKNKLLLLLKFLANDGEKLRFRFIHSTGQLSDLFSSFEDCLSKFTLATKLGDGSFIDTDWSQIKQLITTEDSQSKRFMLNEIAWPMARYSRDVSWIEFCGLTSQAEAPREMWATNFPDHNSLKTIPKNRLELIASSFLKDLAPGPKYSQHVLALFDRLLSSNSSDISLYEKFRPWLAYPLDPKIHNSNWRQQVLDLITRNPAGAQPQISAIFTGETWKISWSLSSIQSQNDYTIPSCDFSFLDGLYDLEFVTGNRVDRMKTFHSVLAAKATGQIDLDLPEDSQFIALLAKERSGKNIRLSVPIQIRERIVMDAPEVSPPFKSSDIHGPFEQSRVMEISENTGSQTIDLLTFPCNPIAPSPCVRGWLLSNSGVQLALSFRDSTGHEIDRSTLSKDPSPEIPFPTWQSFSSLHSEFTTHRSVAPQSTSTIVLTCSKPHDGSAIYIADLWIEHSSLTGGMPPGVEKIGQLKGFRQMVLVDPSSHQFVALTNQGLTLFDLSTKVTKDFKIDGSCGELHAIVWIRFADSRVIYYTRENRFYLLDLRDQEIHLLYSMEPTAFIYTETLDKIALSPDGKYLAWPGKNAGIHLIQLDQPGDYPHRLFETTKANSLHFAEHGKILRAICRNGFFSVNLDGWQSNPPSITNQPPTTPEFRSDNRPATNITPIPSSILTLRTGSVKTLAETRVQNRCVLLPSGVAAIDSEGKPFFVDFFGRIFRFELENLADYPKDH